MPHQIPRTGRILVVDDQAANVRVVTALLERHGYAVTAASNGKDALQAATGEVPDLLLLDMMMPGMDGFELLAALRELPGFRQVPTVFLTAAQDRDLLLRAFEAGAVDYVTKPFMPEELLARVSAHLGLKLTRDRLERVARERQELVNLVAHDLKNPLTSVLFATEMLALPDCKPERVPRYIEIIDGSTRDALGFIRNYLEGQERAASSKAAAVATPCTWMGETLGWLAARYELQLEAKGLRLQVAPLERDASVAIDGLSAWLPRGQPQQAGTGDRGTRQHRVAPHELARDPGAGAHRAEGGAGFAGGSLCGPGCRQEHGASRRSRDRRRPRMGHGCFG
jgi:two-component system sensor histidine kinase/response regulator